MCLVCEHAWLGWSNSRLDFRDGVIPSCVWLRGWGHPLFHVWFGNNGRWDKTSAMWASHGGLYFFFLSSLPRPHTPLLQMRLACTSTRPGPCTAACRWFWRCPTPPMSGPPLRLSPGTALPAWTRFFYIFFKIVFLQKYIFGFTIYRFIPLPPGRGRQGAGRPADFNYMR